MHSILYTSLLLGAVSFGSAGPVGSRDTQFSLQWGPCPSSNSTTLQCAELQVPIDYSKPTGSQVTLAMARIKSGSNQPKGHIFINPGGPGGSAIDLMGQLDLLGLSLPVGPSQLLQDYNLIGLDPRGVGYSTPIKC